MHRSFVCAGIGLAMLLPCCWGCGTGEYERRLESGIARLRTGSKFNALYAPQPLPGTTVSVRVPRMFTASPLVEGAVVDGKPVDPRRVQPTVFNLPWLKLTYETFFPGEGGVKLPCYCYLGAVDMAAARIQNPADDLRVQLNQKPEFETLTNWMDFQGETPEGRGNAWKKLRFVAPQDFVTLDAGGQEKVARLPGVLEIYLHEEAGQCVLIAWRMPTAIEQQAELAKWAPLTAGCTTVGK